MANRPPIPNLTLSRRAKAAIWVVVIVVVLVIALIQFTGVYINWLWFGSLGFRHVYTTVFWTRLILFLIFGVLMALIIGGNILAAYLLRPPFRPMSAEQQNIERYRVMVEPRRWLVLGVVGGIALLAAGLSAQGNWATWQTWLHGVKFGQTDPQFHKDIGFYAWDLPAYRLMLGFGFTAIIFAIILTVIVHYLCGAIRVQTPGPKFTLAARRHLTVLVFVFVVLKAIAYWLDRYSFVFSERSKFTGASYTDVHAGLPARTILFWVAVIIAVGLIASLWLNSTLLPGIAFVSMLVMSILISGIYPAILQGVSVNPNASSKERPYIERNIAATRQAYGIVTGSEVTYKNYDDASAKPDTNAVLASDDPTLDNIRILDPNIVSPNFLKFQQGGSNVYGFAPKLDVDRYDVGGTESDYIVGVRELDASNLSGPQTNWINEHTNYTHGYGFVAAKASTDITQDSTSAGSFAAGNIPQTPTSGPLSLKNPAVYYGELMPNYSIVGAKGTAQEFDGTGATKVRYAGSGGVSLGNLFTRLALAVKYKDSNFVLNNAASASGAKIIFNRDPRVAVQKVAPFLKVDGDPYPIVDQTTGDVLWMVDGYTTLDNYPYSERQSLSSLTDDSLSATNKTASQPNDNINYIRNSVKATVDAYTGKVTLYQWDTADPVLKTWMKVFPKLVKPKSAMPANVQAHVRYPEDLFKVQRATLGDYHVNDPVQFYNQSNRWTVPSDPTDSTQGAQPPYYVLAASPTDPSAAEFQLTSPLTVNKQTYLASYVTVDSDPTNYGHITVLQLPKGLSSVPGPEQVYNTITTDGTIRKDSLFNAGSSGSSTVIHGNLLTLPLGTSFMYVEPLYTQSTTGSGGAFPVLQRVIVVYGNKTGYGHTLQDAIDDFLPGHCEGQSVIGVAVACSASASSGGSGTGSGTSTSTPTATPTTSTASTPGTGATTSAGGTVTLTQVDAAIAALKAAYKTGDFAKIGAAQEKLEQLLNSYPATTTSTPTATPTPTPTPSPTK